ETLHRRYQHAATLPLLQMIAKNVGIRRARGRFILATNIDILFNDELMRFLKEERLEKGKLYRIDRTDVDADVPVHAPVEEQLAYCRGHQLRINTNYETIPLDGPGRRRARPDDPERARDATTLLPDVDLLDGWYGQQTKFRFPYRLADSGAGLV